MGDEANNDPAASWIPHEQRWRPCEGHREREPCRLQLRVALRPNEGVCTVLLEEDEDSVTVLILVCGEVDSGGGVTECPVHIYLERPLAGRSVLDLVRGHRPVPYRNVWQELERESGLQRL